MSTTTQWKLQCKKKNVPTTNENFTWTTAGVLVQTQNQFYLNMIQTAVWSAEMSKCESEHLCMNMHVSTKFKTLTRKQLNL